MLSDPSISSAHGTIDEEAADSIGLPHDDGCRIQR
jgi:hypothetical protein